MPLLSLALLISVGVAVTITVLAARLRLIDQGQVNIVFLLTLILALTGAARWLKPSVPALGMGSMARELADNQPLAVLQQYDAELWEETVPQLNAHAHHGQSRADAASVVRSGLYYIMRRKLAETSNEAAVGFISARMDEMEYYARQGEELCYMLMEPPPGLVFLKAEKPPASLPQQLDSAMIRVIRDAALNPQPAPTEEEVAALLSQWSSEDRRMEDPAPTGSGTRPEQCLATVRSTRRLLEKPVAEAGPLLRMMYGLPLSTRRH